MAAAVKHMRGKREKARPARPRTYGSPLDKAKGYELDWPAVAPLFEAARIIGNAEFVYLIGEDDNGPVKIGLSKDPVARLRQMQTGNPRRLRIERLILGDQTLEKLLHVMWEKYAIKSRTATSRGIGAAPGTEWFTPDCRPRLLPILATAATKQVAHLDEHKRDRAGELISLSALDSLVREAHGEHDFTAYRIEPPRLLSRSAGFHEPGSPPRHHRI